MSSIAELWQPIEAWLKANAPLLLERFEPGASKKQITATEKELGRPLPDELKELLMIHNGGTFAWAGYDLMSLDNIVSTIKMQHELFLSDYLDNENQPTPKVKGLWWNPQWTPFVDFGTGDFYVIDSDPAEQGTVGQIVEFRHDNSARPAMTSSLATWLKQIGEDLARGLYFYDEEHDDLLPQYLAPGFALSTADPSLPWVLFDEGHREQQIAGHEGIKLSWLLRHKPFDFAKTNPILEIFTDERTVLRQELKSCMDTDDHRVFNIEGSIFGDSIARIINGDGEKSFLVYSPLLSPGE